MSDKHYQWWVHLLGEDWRHGHDKPYFLLAKFRQGSKFKIQKWSDSEGFLIFKSEWENTKNYQIFIIGFHQNKLRRMVKSWISLQQLRNASQSCHVASCLFFPSSHDLRFPSENNLAGVIPCLLEIKICMWVWAAPTFNFFRCPRSSHS